MMRAQQTTGKAAETRDAPKAGRALAAGVVLSVLLSACAEPEVILPGKREELRAVLDDEAASAPRPGDVIPENRKLPANLPRTSANANWTQAPGTPATRVSHPAFSGAMQPLWSVKIGAGDSRRNRITADPVIAGGRVYTLDAEARVTATGTNGAPVWSVDLVPERDAGKDATGGGLAIAGDTLFVSSGFGRLTALDAATGAQKWQQRLAATGSGAPTVAGGVVYLTAGDSTAWALDTDSGRILWQIDATTSRNNVLGAPAPALNDQVAIFGFGSGEVQAAFRGGGLRVWDAIIAGQRFGLARTRVTDITGDPVIVGDTVFVGSHSGRTVAMKAATGERLWTAYEGALWRPWVVGGSVYIVSDRNELVRLSAEDGTRVWGTELPFFVKDKPRRQRDIFAHMGPVIAGGRLYVASSDGLIRAFDPASGALIGTTEIPGGATTAPVVAGGVMYVVSKNGELYAFR